MRRVERIPIVLKKLKDPQVLAEFLESDKDSLVNVYSNWFVIISHWRAYPDLRFGQLLINLGLIPDGWVWNVEESDWLVENGYLKVEDVKFWGRNYDSEGNKLPETEFILLRDLTDDHIKGIVSHVSKLGGSLSKSYMDYFKQRLTNSPAIKENRAKT